MRPREEILEQASRSGERGKRVTDMENLEVALDIRDLMKMLLEAEQRREFQAKRGP